MAGVEVKRYVVTVSTHDDDRPLTTEEVGEAIHTWRYGHDVLDVQEISVD